MTTTTADTRYVTDTQAHSKRNSISGAILHVSIFIGTIVGIWFSTSLLMGLVTVLS